LDVSKQNWLDAMGADAMASEPAAEAPAVGAMMELPAVDPLAVSGDIISAGSSTVFPLAERMAERFQNEGYTGQITIDSIGSGAGFSRFCEAGETDVSNASRIKDSEVESCGAIGRVPIQFQVGIDALAVTVSTDNDFVSDVTVEELGKIFSSEAELWSDVRADWPAEPIQRFIPGTDSGTFDFFTEVVMEEVYGETGKEQTLGASNLQLSEDDNVLVQGIQASPYAIGYFGFAYFNENQDVLNALSVNGIAPTADSAESGEYYLSRPLFLYSDAGVMQEKPQVADYINYFLSNVNAEILDVGYFPASETILNQSKANWLEAMGQ
jgi:phosphate binding protein